MLNKLQQQLEQIYEVDTSLQVSDFVITDPLVAQFYDKSATARSTNEKLLVCQNDEALDVALYLDAAIVAHLEQDDPSESLHDGNIHQFWVALEGVSHFVYLCWNAQYDREVSLFELELQAEVDKFIAVLLMFGHQYDLLLLRRVLVQLFLKSDFDSTLNREELFRYRLANKYAYHFCSQLLVVWHDRRNTGLLFNAVRRFYRLTHHYKLRYIIRSCL